MVFSHALRIERISISVNSSSLTELRKGKVHQVSDTGVHRRGSMDSRTVSRRQK